MTKNYGQPENHEGVRRDSRDFRGEQGTGAALVSVVIPCYNQAHFLGEAIESVLAQSYPNFEIVVVDDGSTDDTSEVAKRYPKVRLVRQENRGLSGARNSGLARSEGEYVVFLDADDRLLPEALEVGVRQLSAHPECAFVSGHCRRIASDGSPITEGQHHRVEDDPYTELLRSCPIFVPTGIYRRSVFETVGGFDTSFKAAEDFDLYYRIARRFPIYFHNALVAEVRQHDANMTRNPTLMLESNLSALRSQWKYVKGVRRYEEAYKAGVKLWRAWYGDRLVDEIRAHIRNREWERMLKGALVLLRYYPRGLSLLMLSERRMERHRLARRLGARREELEVHERRLEELEDAQGELGSALLAKERQEVQLLRRRVRRLERRMQNLNRRVLVGWDGKVWRSLKRLGHIRAKVLKR